MKNKFWNFVDKNEKQAELQLYGDISETTWWGDEVTPRQFLDDLNALGDKEEIVVRINSSGGDVFAAYAIATNLKDNPAKIIGKIDGVAASAATIIASMCDYLMLPSYVAYMIHNPISVAMGEAKDFRKMADTLEKIKDGIINAYIHKTGKSKEEISNMMDETTWLTGKEAVELGFADEIMFEDTSKAVMNGNMLVINSVKHDLKKFKNVPADLIVNMIEDKKPNNLDNKEELELEIKNVDDLKKYYPDLVNQVANDAVEEAVKAERNRLKSIDEIANHLDTKLVENAKYGEKVMNAQELAFMAIKNDQSLGDKFLNNLKDDVDDSGVDDVGSDGAALNSAKDKSKKIISAMAAGANERRG